MTSIRKGGYPSARTAGRGDAIAPSFRHWLSMMCRLGAVVVTVAACGTNRTSVGVARAPDTTLGSVVATPQNAILAIGGTTQLHLTGATITGAPIAAFDSVTYMLVSTVDTLRLRLGADGTMTGVTSSGATPVLVNTFAYQGGLGKGDQVVVQVTPTALTGLTLSIHPVAPDSAKLSRGTVKAITPALRNPTTGVSVPTPNLRLTVRPADAARMAGFSPNLNLPDPLNGGVAVQRSNPYLGATLNSILAQGGEGSAWVYAEVNAYGTLLRDSVQYSLSYPYTGTVGILISAATTLTAQAASGTQLNGIYAVGAVLTFSNAVIAAINLPITFTFDKPEGATAIAPLPTVGGTSGNISVLAPTQKTTRQFLIPGVYSWVGTVGGNLAPFSGQTVVGSITIKP